MSGSHSSTVTVGGFVLSNFFADSVWVFDPFTSSGAISSFIASYTTSPSDAMFFAETDASGATIYSGQNYLWNWDASLAASVDGTFVGSQIISSTSTGDAWSLTVNLADPLNTAGSLGAILPAGEQILYYGNSVDAFGAFVQAGPTGNGAGSLYSPDMGATIITPTITFTGSGSASLETVLHGLSVNMSLGTSGDYVAVQFHLTDVTASTSTDFVQFVGSPCYVPGTRLAVPAGEADIASLAIGDRVMTATGVARAIKWIGRRAYTAAVIAANPHLRAVTIRADAIAPGMPHRDLMVSPMHALYIDDVFVPAAALVNGVSILRHDDLAPVSYIHIELDQHDVVFAEGLPAETFVDDASRQMFDNADEFYELYGADTAVAAFAAPRIEEGVQLEAIRRRIAARAFAVVTTREGALRGNIERIEGGMLIGWAAGTATVELDVLADDEIVGRVIANRYRADLDFHGINGGRAGFSMALPA